MMDIYATIAVGIALILGSIPLIFTYRDYKLGYRDFLVSWCVDRKYESKEMTDALRRHDIVNIERIKRCVDGKMECEG